MVQQVAYGLYDMNISALIPATNVVGFSNAAAVEDMRQRSRMILDIEPVTDVQTIAIDRQLLFGEALNNHVRELAFPGNETVRNCSSS